MRSENEALWYQREEPRKRILTASDDARLLDILTRGLNRHNLEVITVSLASDLAGLSPPSSGEPSGLDVILLDVASGAASQSLELLRRARARRIEAPALCLVSPADAAAVNAAVPGVQSIVVKPIDLAELASELKRLAKPKNA